MISWAFSTEKQRSATWYISAMVLVLTIVILWIVTKIYIMSVVIVLFAWVYILIENNSANIVSVNIDERKITISGTHYYWEELNSFSIVELNGRPHFLRLNPKKRFSSFIDIPFVEEVDPVMVQQFLQNFLQEDGSSQISKMDTLIHASKI